MWIHMFVPFHAIWKWLLPWVYSPDIVKEDWTSITLCTSHNRCPRRFLKFLPQNPSLKSLMSFIYQSSESVSSDRLILCLNKQGQSQCQCLHSSCLTWAFCISVTYYDFRRWCCSWYYKEIKIGMRYSCYDEFKRRDHWECLLLSLIFTTVLINMVASHRYLKPVTTDSKWWMKRASTML